MNLAQAPVSPTPARPAMALDPLPDLHPATTRELLAAECLLPRLPADLAMAVGRVVPSTWDPGGWERSIAQWAMSHPLSWAVEQITPGRPLAHWRSFPEAAALRRWGPVLLAARVERDTAAMGLALARLCSELTGQPATLRATGMRLKSDPGVGEIRLMDAATARQQWLEVIERICAPRTGSPLLAAIVMSLAVVNAHPFPDGNGRLSRCVFHLMLWLHGLPFDVHVPIYEAMHWSRGGYEIRLRQAELHGDWNPIVSYYCRLLALAAGAAR